MFMEQLASVNQRKFSLTWTCVHFLVQNFHIHRKFSNHPYLEIQLSPIDQTSINNMTSLQCVQFIWIFLSNMIVFCLEFRPICKECSLFVCHLAIEVVGFSRLVANYSYFVVVLGEQIMIGYYYWRGDARLWKRNWMGRVELWRPISSSKLSKRVLTRI